MTQLPLHLGGRRTYHGANSTLSDLLKIEASLLDKVCKDLRVIGTRNEVARRRVVQCKILALNALMLYGLY